MFAIDQIIGGLGSIANLFIPIVQDHVEQKYEEEFKDRLASLQKILSVQDPRDRALALGAYISKLCVDAGTPPGVLSGESIEVPLQHFQALITIGAGKIRDDELLARVEFKRV